MMFKGVQDVSSQKMICTTKDGAGLGGSWASSEGADRGGVFCAVELLGEHQEFESRT